MRSWLFVPGNVEKKIHKAIASTADVVIIDLEDSVPPREKEIARDLAASIVKALPEEHRKIYLRVNAEEKWFCDDIQSAVNAGYDGVILPKISNRFHMLEAESIILRAEEGRQKKLDLIPLIENAEGVLNIQEILSSSTRIKRVTFGVLDYLLDIGGRLSATGYESHFAKSYIALASAACGKERPIDTVFPAYYDKEGFRGDATRARALGYQGKLLIHPAQIDDANELFSPDEKEIRDAEQAVSAYEMAESVGLAAVQVSGRMVDKPVYMRALQVLQQAREYGLG